MLEEIPTWHMLIVRYLGIKNRVSAVSRIATQILQETSNVCMFGIVEIYIKIIHAGFSSSFFPFVQDVVLY
jgi:hypothetical protein